MKSADACRSGTACEAARWARSRDSTSTSEPVHPRRRPPDALDCPTLAAAPAAGRLTPSTVSIHLRHAHDLELVRGVLRRDRSSLDEFAQRMECVPRLLAARNAQLGNPIRYQDLPDLVQEVLLVVWRKLEQYEGRAGLETWIFRIGSFELMNVLRRHRTTTSFGSDETPREPVEPPAAAPDAWVQYADLHDGLLRLSADGRQVVRLKHYDGLTFAAIGARLGISTSMAKVHYYDAIRRLRELLHAEKACRDDQL